MINEIKTYFEKTICSKIKLIGKVKLKSVPFFILDQYDFFQINLFEQSAIVAITKETFTPTPGSVKKQHKMISKLTEHPIIFAFRFLTAYNRKRLIEHKISFIVPNNQMYLPYLGIDLREYFKMSHEASQKFSPATQATIIGVLNGKIEKILSISEIVKKLEYSRITASRIMNELKLHQFGVHHRNGKQKLISLEDTLENMWQKALPLMGSPVLERIYLTSATGLNNFYYAGQTALSEITSLAGLNYDTYAIGKNEWFSLRKQMIKFITPNQDEANYELEIWTYPPQLLSNKQRVDKYSLYLSLKENSDERIQITLEELNL